MSKITTNSDERVSVYGCSSCDLIFEASIYHYGIFGSSKNFCPGCGEDSVQSMGLLPRFMESGGLFYLSDDSVTVGPYKTEYQAQCSLWEWFEEKHAQEKVPREGTVIHLFKE